MAGVPHREVRSHLEGDDSVSRQGGSDTLPRADDRVALYNIGSSDQRGVAEFFVLLGPEHFATYLAELVEALETGSDPGAFWAKWIDVVCERTRTKADGPEGRG